MKRIGTIIYELSEQEHEELKNYIQSIKYFVKGSTYLNQDEAESIIERIEDILEGES